MVACNTEAETWYQVIEEVDVKLQALYGVWQVDVGGPAEKQGESAPG